MNSPVIIFSNDNFPVLMAFKLRFLFLLFVVEGRGRQPAARRSCCISAAHYALTPRAMHLYFCGTLYLCRRVPAGRRRSYLPSVVFRSSGEALPLEVLPPELLSPRIASSSAFVYPYPAEIKNSESSGSFMDILVTSPEAAAMLPGEA